MTNISLIFKQLLEQVGNVEVADVYKLKTINFSTPYILLGIDVVTNDKRLYIDVTNENWSDEQWTAFPKWKGLTITREYFERLGPLENKEFIIISQEDKEFGEIFEKVIQNLYDHIMVDKETNLFTTIYSVLDLWHNFFKSSRNKKLTEEEQMGLFGELYYLLTYLEKNPDEPPLIIDYWKGPKKYRVDFVKNQVGVEIKTRSIKLGNEVRISNEQQLELSDVVNSIFLYILEIEMVNSIGDTIQDLINQIREKLQNAPSSLLRFNDLLLSEYFIQDDVYNDSLFFIHSEEVYNVTDEFPKLTTTDLPIGIKHLSYSIDLTHCVKFKIDLESVYSLK